MRTLAILLLPVLVVWGASMGMVQFGAYDESSLVALAWRDHLGQIPGVDYPLTLPPALLLLCRVAFAVEPSLRALVWSSAAMWGLQVLAASSLRAPISVAALLAVPVVATGYPWHSAMTSTWTLLLAFALAERRAGWILVLAAVETTLKPNVAGPALLVGLVVAWRPVLTGMVAGAVVMRLGGVDPLLLLNAYAHVAGRSLGHADIDAVVTWDLWTRRALILGYAVAVVDLWCHRWTARAPLGLAFAAVATVGLRTDWDILQHGLPLLVGGLVLAGARSRWLTAAVLASAVAMGASRQRTAYVGEFYSSGPLVTVTEGFYAGLSTSPGMLAVLDEARRLPEGATFYGVRLEFLYPETARTPLRGLPVWWHFGSSYWDKATVVDAFTANPPDVAVFLPGDHGRTPRALVAYVEGHYRRAEGFAAIEVWLREP